MSLPLKGVYWVNVVDNTADASLAASTVKTGSHTRVLEAFPASRHLGSLSTPK
jgi:hypothetical protein